VLSWNNIVIIVCAVLDVLLFIVGFIDWVYFSRTILLTSYGCTFILGKRTKEFTWDEMHLELVENSSFFFGDSEIPCEGVILSVKPILKPLCVGAMTYCRFSHPSASVFVRFASPSDEKLIRTSGKFIYRGFVANKDEILCFLAKKTGVGLREPF